MTFLILVSVCIDDLLLNPGIKYQCFPWKFSISHMLPPYTQCTKSSPPETLLVARPPFPYVPPLCDVEQPLSDEKLQSLGIYVPDTPNPPNSKYIIFQLCLSA